MYAKLSGRTRAKVLAFGFLLTMVLSARQDDGRRGCQPGTGLGVGTVLALVEMPAPAVLAGRALATAAVTSSCAAR